MRISSQLLLTFLLNAFWQVALIAALAAVGSWLLRNSVARYRHWLWVSALCLAFLVPAITSSRALFETDVQPEVSFARESIAPFEFETAPPSLQRNKLNQTALNFSSESNSWTGATRNLFRVSSFIESSN